MLGNKVGHNKYIPMYSYSQNMVLIWKATDSSWVDLREGGDTVVKCFASRLNWLKDRELRGWRPEKKIGWQELIWGRDENNILFK